MNTSVDTSTSAALRELSRRRPPGVSPGDLQRFLRHNYERVWTRVAHDTTLDDDDHWRRWSAGILARVRNYLKYTRQPSILVLAGARYADGWAPEARGLGVTVDEPLRGLELGARRDFAQELLLRTPARSLSDALDVSPRDQLLSFAAAFRHRLRAPEATW